MNISTFRTEAVVSYVELGRNQRLLTKYPEIIFL